MVEADHIAARGRRGHVIQCDMILLTDGDAVGDGKIVNCQPVKITGATDADGQAAADRGCPSSLIAGALQMHELVDIDILGVGAGCDHDGVAGSGSVDSGLDGGVDGVAADGGGIAGGVGNVEHGAHRAAQAGNVGTRRAGGNCGGAATRAGKGYRGAGIEIQPSHGEGNHVVGHVGSGAAADDQGSTGGYVGGCVDGDGEAGGCGAGVASEVGLPSGQGMPASVQGSGGDAPVSGRVGHAGAQYGGAIGVIEGDGGTDLGTAAGDGRGGVVGQVVAVVAAAVGGRMQIGGGGGCGRGVDGHGQAGGGGTGVAGQVGLFGGQGMRARAQNGGGDAPVAGRVGHVGAEHGDPVGVIEGDGGTRLGAISGDGRDGIVGPVVTVGAAAVGGCMQIGGERRGGGGGVDGHGEAGGGGAGVAGHVCLLGSQGMRAAAQGGGGDAPVAGGAGHSGAEHRGAVGVIDGDGGTHFRATAGDGWGGNVRQVVAGGAAAVGGRMQIGGSGRGSGVVDGDTDDICVGVVARSVGDHRAELVDTVHQAALAAGCAGPASSVLVPFIGYRRSGLLATQAEGEVIVLGDAVAVVAAGVSEVGEGQGACCRWCLVELIAERRGQAGLVPRNVGDRRGQGLVAVSAQGGGGRDVNPLVADVGAVQGDAADGNAARLQGDLVARHGSGAAQADAGGGEIVVAEVVGGGGAGVGGCQDIGGAGGIGRGGIDGDDDGARGGAVAVVVGLDVAVGALDQGQRRVEHTGRGVRQNGDLRLVICEAVAVGIQEDRDIGAQAGRRAGECDACELGDAVVVQRPGIRCRGKAEVADGEHMRPSRERRCLEWQRRCDLAVAGGKDPPVASESLGPNLASGRKDMCANGIGERADEMPSPLTVGDVAGVKLDDAVVGERQPQYRKGVGMLIHVFQGKGATGKPDLRFAAVRDDMHRRHTGHPFERSRNLFGRAPVGRQDDRLDLAAQPGDELVEIGNVGVDEGDFLFQGAHGLVSVVRLCPGAE